MKKKHLTGLAIGLMMFFCAVGVSHAVVLTFEDVPTVNFPNIPNGYGGLNWDNMIFTSKTLDPGLYDESLPWYGSIRYGIVSGSQIARNAMGNPTQVFANSGQAFDFNGAYFTSARRHNLNIDIIGFRGDLQVYSQTISVDTASPTYFEFNYKRIDKLTISSYGGTPDPNRVDTYFYDFLMDDFNFVIVSGLTITASAGTGGTISPSGSISVNSGESRTFSITPAACYDVDTVLVNGSAVILTNGQYTFANVTANQTISASFKQNPCCTYSVQTQIDAARQAGIQSCKDNPASCGLFNQTSLNSATQSGIQSCKDNPAGCGLFSQTQIDAAKQTGIQSCKDNPASCSLFSQTQLDTAISTATASMYTKTQLDQAVKDEQLKWDVNGDGKIGLEEVIRILQVIVGLRP